MSDKPLSACSRRVFFVNYSVVARRGVCFTSSGRSGVGAIYKRVWGTIYLVLYENRL